MSDEPCGAAQPHFAASPSEEVAMDEATTPEPLEESASFAEALFDEDDRDIEIVDTFESFEREQFLEIVPPPLESGPMPLEELAAALMEIADTAPSIPLRTRAFETIEPPAPAPCAETIEPPAPAPYAETIEPPRPAEEPFAFFVRTLSEVARESGADIGAARIGAALEDDEVARAWRAILRGESDDYSICGGSSLDEWSAGVLARILSAPGKTAVFRRELRARGVAAFGLVMEAA